MLRNWKTKRQDKKTELHWKLLEQTRPLDSFEKYQKEWNFIEADYNFKPSNNGLDYANPGFAFETKLMKYWISEKAS